MKAKCQSNWNCKPGPLQVSSSEADFKCVAFKSLGKWVREMHANVVSTSPEIQKAQKVWYCGIKANIVVGLFES